MESLWAVAPEVPGHVGIVQVGLGISLLTVNKIGELNWVFNEEDWGVISNHVEVSFFSVELKSKSSRVSHGVRESLLSSNSGEPGEHGGSLADLVEELGFGVLGKIVGHFEVAMSASTNGVDYSLGNSLSIELSKLVNKMNIL